ncbi:MAG: FAD-binding oxidoreductase, partial [Chloroflexi bacterium]|nr:FAD-binding oxidoreductase [Chloroflexota bacterium]
MTNRSTRTASDYAIDGMTPNNVVKPASVEELQQTLKDLSNEGLTAIPWGGGTRIALGNTPKTFDTALDLTGLDNVIAHNPGDLTVTVEAGLTMAKLGTLLAEHGQFLAIDPPLPDRATVGGTLAIGTAGPLKWQYGNPRDLVIGMSVVQSDGT